MKKRKKKQTLEAAIKAPARRSGTGWQTSDADEIARRAGRARAETMTIRNLDEAEPFFSSFSVFSESSGVSYEVEIRSLSQRSNSCNCPDYRINGLGTCKHIEAVLDKLGKKPRLFKNAARHGSPKAEIYLQRVGDPVVRIDLTGSASPAVRRYAKRFFDGSGKLLGPPSDAVPALERALARLRTDTRRRIRLGLEVREWAEDQAREARRRANRLAFEEDVATGKRSLDLLHHPLYDYQIEGLLHLAFGERVMLVDDMGLGKTVQAVAACALLKELRDVQRVLVVSPASLKTEWEEQIRKFTNLPFEIIFGPKPQRIQKYRGRSFFYLSNYEQILRDVPEVNDILAPDVVILDEAQRIKNWSTKTAQAMKRLTSPYAFVLTGTPLENRIDEIFSIAQFLDPHVFGPLHRFNREFYKLNERGRPAGYKNLSLLRKRLRPIMLRRRKEEVEDELPQRVDNNYFVGMAPQQREPYSGFEMRVAQLLTATKHRPLTREEQDQLMRWLGCMRMLCDTTYILDPETKVSPKIEELERVFEDIGLRNGRKALVFSEWERMLQLVRDLAQEMGIEYAWHTGSVPQKKRREEINRFKDDPQCKLFLSTDSGGVGLNLQAASVVINLDLPWNPAKLEQRIARAWRKHQRETVNVINLITSNSIEHRMLATLAVKRELADGVLDGIGDLSALEMPSSGQTFLNRLKLIMGAGDAVVGTARGKTAPEPPKPPLEPGERFRQDLMAELPSRVQLIEVRPLPDGEKSPNRQSTLVVVDRDTEKVAEVIQRLHRDAYGKTSAGPLEVLDRQTFETMQRLANLGWLKTPDSTELHRSPALERPGPTPEEKRRKLARGLAENAGRKLDMGRLLAQGGFPSEALLPVLDAVELALRALAALAGIETNEDSLAASVIHEKLVMPGFLEADDAARVSLLRELATTAGEIDPETARSQVEAGAAIVEKADAALVKDDLRAS
jgi:hypothetical protein